jgi:hypothetical protein
LPASPEDFGGGAVVPGFLVEMTDVEAAATFSFLDLVSVAVLFPAAFGAFGAFPVGSAAPPALGAGQPGRSA